MFNKLLASRAPAAAILIRLMVGAVFLSEGIQKFLFPAEVGAGRFEKIGFSAPGFTAQFVASFEIA
jgi:putative oxidoreductase